MYRRTNRITWKRIVSRLFHKIALKSQNQWGVETPMRPCFSRSFNMRSPFSDSFRTGGVENACSGSLRLTSPEKPSMNVSQFKIERPEIPDVHLREDIEATRLSIKTHRNVFVETASSKFLVLKSLRNSVSSKNLTADSTPVSKFFIGISLDIRVPLTVWPTSVWPIYLAVASKYSQSISVRILDTPERHGSICDVYGISEYRSKDPSSSFIVLRKDSHLSQIGGINRNRREQRSHCMLRFSLSLFASFNQCLWLSTW